ncbi:MAG: hypothetical protein Q8S54_10245 [Bacteroidota bacterium]|nr:hypothetical protein [Odoribacter sp.]MDP3643554.1 hypothetical protein [Bacteroidota bacterium]
MKLNLFLLLTFLTILSSFNVFAQNTENSNLILTHHDHHRNEIGLSYSPVYLLKEKGFASGMHLHFVRNLHNSKFGLGLGYERIFDKHKHSTFGLEVMYRPIEKLSFSVSPGLTFEDNISGVNPALHFETTYDFEIGDFHIGPAFEFAIDPEDIHLSLGVHLGFGF